MAEFAGGRRYGAGRRVRLADVDVDGRVRFDAVARYLQDVATDDVRDAGVEDAVAWVVRRTTIVAEQWPVYGEAMTLATWCSGTGSALAERRTTIRGELGSSVEAVSLWVSLDRASMRPVPVTGAYFDPYRSSAGDRRVRARFLLPPTPGPGDGGPGRSWPLRASDIDPFRHLNNAVAWMAVEEEALRLAPGVRLRRGRVEYRRPVGPGEVPRLLASRDGTEVSVWLVGADGSAAVSARLGC